MKKSYIISILIVLLSFLTGLYFYTQMPSRVASHWNLNGQVNGYTSKDFFIFFMPALVLIIFLLILILPKIDPLKKNYKTFQKQYDILMVLIVGFLYYIYLITLFYNTAYAFDIDQIISPAIAVLFFYVGVITEKAKQNWFVGIRTPWTLSSKNVWDKTHKMAGKFFKAAGVIALFGIISRIFLVASLAVLITAAVYSVVYSYIEFKKEKSKKN